MKIVEITVSSGCTFNDPYEPFRNHRPSVTFRATIEETCDDFALCTARLQEWADERLAKHRKDILEARLHEECTCEMCGKAGDQRASSYLPFSPDKPELRRRMKCCNECRYKDERAEEERRRADEDECAGVKENDDLPEVSEDANKSEPIPF